MRSIVTKKNKALQRFVPKAALICAMFLLAVVACGGQSEVQEYFDQISALNEYNERFERFNELIDRESQIDPRSVTRAEVLDLVTEIFGLLRQHTKPPEWHATRCVQSSHLSNAKQDT